jgi:hypothetical protein
MFVLTSTWTTCHLPILLLLFPLQSISQGVEQAPIIDSPHILLQDPAVLGPEHEIRGGPFKDCATPSNWIRDVALSLDHVDNVPPREVIASIGILCKDLLKLLGHEAPLVVVGACVAAVLCAIDLLEVDTEEGIGNPRGARRPREVDVDDEEGDGREDDAEAQTMEPHECVLRPQNTVVVPVEEVAVLLEDGLVGMFLGPVVGRRALGCLYGRGKICACSAWE